MTNLKFYQRVLLLNCVMLTGCTASLKPFFKNASSSLTTVSTVLSGNAMLGAVSGATVKLYPILPNGSPDLTQVLGTTVTDAQGNYSFTLTHVPSRAVMVQMTGGTYTEEASGDEIDLSNKTFHTALPKLTSGNLTAAVGPLPELAYQKFKARVSSGLGATSTEQAIANANYSVAQAFGFTDIVGVLPSNPVGALSNNASGQYALLLVAISKSAQLSGVDSTAVVDAFQKILATSGDFNLSNLGNVPSMSVSNADGSTASITPPSLQGLQTILTQIGNGSTSVAGVTPPIGFTPPSFAVPFAANVQSSSIHPAALHFLRDGAASVSLPSGKVLISGGMGAQNEMLSSSELYDLVSNSWSLLPNLTTARRYHTATVLKSGKVLIVGGANDAGVLSSVEIFDPNLATVSAGAAMHLERYGHTATLLNDGRVLVSGGGNAGGTHATAEIYDPATNTWTMTNALVSGHQAHAAVLLANGKVLVAGGYSTLYPATLMGAVVTPSVELFDPTTNSWTSQASLHVPRRNISATRLPNGNILIAGGVDLYAALSSGNPDYAKAEVYSPILNTWSLTAPMLSVRQGASASTALLDGRVLVTGGIGPTGAALASAEIYDSGSNAWVPTASTQTPHQNHTSILLSNGAVLIVGGRLAIDTSLANEESFDSLASLWMASL